MQRRIHKSQRTSTQKDSGAAARAALLEGGGQDAVEVTFANKDTRQFKSFRECCATLSFDDKMRRAAENRVFPVVLRSVFRLYCFLSLISEVIFKECI